MKKKICLTAILSVLLLIIFIAPVFADVPVALQGMSKVNQVSGTGKLSDAGNQIIGIIHVVGMLVAVGTLMMIGIRYMILSPEGKAELKQKMVPYIIGAVITFAAANLVKIVYDLTTGTLFK